MEFDNYQIGDIVNVTLKENLYLHSDESFVGSEARLNKRPKSQSAGWLGVSTIYGKYAGCRPDVLKLQLDMLNDPVGKNVLAISSYQIEEHSKVEK